MRVTYDAPIVNTPYAHANGTITVRQRRVSTGGEREYGTYRWPDDVLLSSEFGVAMRGAPGDRWRYIA